MKTWNASNYRRKKAERLAKAEPEWVTNPETGAEFYLRRVSGLVPLVASYMPRILTDEAVTAWKEKGVEAKGEDSLQATAEMVEEGQRNAQLMARVVSQSCVIPKLVPNPSADDELDPSELDEADLHFIFRWATGQVGVNLKGGAVMDMADLKSLSKKAGRRSRVSTNGQDVQPVA